MNYSGKLHLLYGCFIALWSLFSCMVFASEPQLLWSINNKFNMPESAAWDARRQVVYVSNVNHYARDNNGFISRVANDGATLDLKWIEGLHSPTGITVYGDILYVVDYDALVIIDLLTEKIVKRVPASDADAIPVLNDVAVSVDGEVYVSGSRSRTIYHLTGQGLEVWLKDEERLKSANGLLVHGNILLHGGEYWTAYDIEGKKTVDAFSVMGEGVNDIDGITKLTENSFLVSLIDDPKLWLLQVGQPPRPYSEDELNGIDMQFVPGHNRLYLPRVGNTLSAYQISSP